MIKNLAKIGVAALVAVASLVSGSFWLASANAQIASLTASPEKAIKLVQLSSFLNQWAAGAAMIGGVCVAFALILEDSAHNSGRGVQNNCSLQKLGECEKGE